MSLCRPTYTARAPSTRACTSRRCACSARCAHSSPYSDLLSCLGRVADLSVMPADRGLAQQGPVVWRPGRFACQEGQARCALRRLGRGRARAGREQLHQETALEQVACAGFPDCCSPRQLLQHPRARARGASRCRPRTARVALTRRRCSPGSVVLQKKVSCFSSQSVCAAALSSSPVRTSRGGERDVNGNVNGC